MYFVGLGLVLLALKFMEIGPVAAWAWWIVLSPFALAVGWWTWADATGYTKRKAMERERPAQAPGLIAVAKQWECLAARSGAERGRAQYRPC